VHVVRELEAEALVDIGSVRCHGIRPPLDQVSGRAVRALAADDLRSRSFRP
jgi:hypothetical protein